MKYKYKPVKFYLITLILTWGFWFTAAFFSHKDDSAVISTVFMALGLIVPAVISLLFVLFSKSPALKKDYRQKLSNYFHINIKLVFSAIIIYAAIVYVSAGISVLCGGSEEQFRFTEDFSFSVASVPTFLLLIITAVFEELGWRGYAEDSIAQYNSWFKESVIFGFLWALWHLPLFFIKDSYQYNILQMNFMYMVNFILGMVPVGFFITWVYVGNRRSIFACSVVHFFMNFFQERINLTQDTKCIESVVILMAAIIIVLCNKDMFFEKKHIGNMISESL